MATTKVEIERKARIETLLSHDDYTFIRFNGAAMIRHKGPYEVLTQDTMVQVMWREFPGAALSNVNEALTLVSALSPDKTTDLDGVIGIAPRSANHHQIWDMKKAQLTDDLRDYVYETDIIPDTKHIPLVQKFLLDLAQGDEDLAYDYIQALAPLLLHNKPAGVVWFIGGGSNGKSLLLKVVHKLFARYLVSLTTSAIEDGRDTPRLNGALGNICLESSETRVDDSERYKAVGTHEPFMVHKFHSQESAAVYPNGHTVYNGNNIPTFRDKTKGSRRRTLIVPFNATFQDDPTFEANLMTPEFMSGFLAYLMQAAADIHARGGKYKWSEATMGAKREYDDSVNSAEAFAAHLNNLGAIGFKSYQLLGDMYANYCSQHGLEPLRVQALKRALQAQFDHIDRITAAISVGANNTVKMKVYAWADDPSAADWWDNGLGVRAGRKELQTVFSGVPLEDW